MTFDFNDTKKKIEEVFFKNWQSNATINHLLSLLGTQLSYCKDTEGNTSNTVDRLVSNIEYISENINRLKTFKDESKMNIKAKELFDQWKEDAIKIAKECELCITAGRIEIKSSQNK